MPGSLRHRRRCIYSLFPLCGQEEGWSRAGGRFWKVHGLEGAGETDLPPLGRGWHMLRGRTWHWVPSKAVLLRGEVRTSQELQLFLWGTLADPYQAKSSQLGCLGESNASATRLAQQLVSL